jgi:plasma kallikrein
MVVHENFHNGTLYNDVALLLLKDQVKLEQEVNTICLPPQDAVFDHSRCFTTGWGKDLFGNDGQYQVILKKVELPVVPFLQCEKALQKTRLSEFFILDKSFICAGGEQGKGEVFIGFFQLLYL